MLLKAGWSLSTELPPYSGQDLSLFLIAIAPDLGLYLTAYINLRRSPVKYDSWNLAAQGRGGPPPPGLPRCATAPQRLFFKGLAAD